MTSGENGLAVSQLLISLSRASEVSNFEQTATKERMILDVRPPEQHPPSPDTPPPGFTALQSVDLHMTLSTRSQKGAPFSADQHRIGVAITTD
jgi:hypothetical protein